MARRYENLNLTEFEIIEKHKAREIEEGSGSLFANLRFNFKRSKPKDDSDDLNFKSLLTQTAVCALAVLTLLAVKSTETPITYTDNGVSGETVASVFIANNENDDEEEPDIGRLKFAENMLEDNESYPVNSSSAQIVMPASGEIVAMYDGDKNLGVTMKVDSGSSVKTATDGVVIEVSPVMVKMGLDDGREISYKGITPNVKVGDCLLAGGEIGKATSNKIIISLIENGKAVDPLSLLSKIK